LLVAAIYNPPDTSQNEATEVDRKPQYGLSRYEFWGCILSGCVWCFYNIAFILPLSFGPDFLIAQGVEYSIVGAITSLTGWLIIPALPLGSWFAERLGKPYLIMIPSFVAIAVVTWLIPLTSWYAVMFALLGILFGLAGGLIMALPAQVLRVENRAVGMGIFFTVYYMGMGIGSSIAGYARDASGDPAAPLWMAGWTIIIAILALIGFRVILLNPPENFSVK
jgi:predicted MFS family arabinose efflux permease